MKNRLIINGGDSPKAFDVGVPLGSFAGRRPRGGERGLEVFSPYMRGRFIVAVVLAAGCGPTSAPANDGLDRRLEHAEDRLREIDETLTAVQEDAGVLRERVSRIGSRG